MIDEEIVLDEAQRVTVADLQIQAMMFDMDVDVEAARLIPKRIDVVPIWIKKWKEKENGSDRNPEDYEGGKDDFAR